MAIPAAFPLTSADAAVYDAVAHNKTSSSPDTKDDGKNRMDETKSSSPNSSPFPVKVLTFLPYIILCLGAFLMFGETADDPFITFRYAANIAAGHGPVFNIGERVEGFSSPLHLLLSVCLLKLCPALGILFKAKLLSLASALAAIFLTGGLAKQIGFSRRISIIAQILLALNVNFAIAAVNGLETTLYTALLLAAVLFYIREYQAGHGYTSALIFVAALLARPEAILIIVFLALLRMYEAKQRHIAVFDLAMWLSLIILLTTLMLSLRFAYYHDVLPNTYYAKHVALYPSFKRGSQCLLQGLSPRFLELNALRHGSATPVQIFYIAASPLFWCLALAGCRRFADRGVLVILWFTIGAACLFVLRSGGDWMMGWRFMAAVLPYLALLQSQGIVVCVGRLNARFRQDTDRCAVSAQRGSRRETLVFICVFLVWLLSLAASDLHPWYAVRFSTQDADLISANSVGLGRVWLTTARYVQTKIPLSTSVAYTEMGYCPFVNPEIKFLDLDGLTDHEIAMLPTSLKSVFGVNMDRWYQADSEVGKILQRRQPKYILLWASSAYTPSVVENYRIVDIVPCSSDRQQPFNVLVYKRDK